MSDTGRATPPPQKPSPGQAAGGVERAPPRVAELRRGPPSARRGARPLTVKSRLGGKQDGVAASRRNGGG